MFKKLVLLILCLVCPALFAQQALNNDGLIKLIKAGLSDDLIVSTINASPAAYNTSADGIVALKASGASDKIIAAMLMKSAGAAVPMAAVQGTPAASALPPGIDEIGVYYKDKN